MFDFDGTLADTLPWMRSIFNELATEHGFRRVDADEFERFRDLHGPALFRELQLPLWKLPRVVAAMRQRMSQRADHLSLFPQVGDVLQCLHAAGMELGIVSSNAADNVERILGPANVAMITHLRCGASMFGKAPRLRQVVRAAGVSPQQAIYIGDEVRDAEAARKAGIAFGAVTWGQHSIEALQQQNPSELFVDVPEIAQKLLGQ